MLCCSPRACACTTVVAAAWSRSAAGCSRRESAPSCRPPAAAAGCVARESPAAPAAAATPAGTAAAGPAAAGPPGPPAAPPLALLPPPPPPTAPFGAPLLFIFLLGEASGTDCTPAAAALCVSAALRLPGDVRPEAACCLASTAGRSGAAAPAGLLRKDGRPRADGLAPGACCCCWVSSPVAPLCCRTLPPDARWDRREAAGLTAGRGLGGGGCELLRPTLAAPFAAGLAWALTAFCCCCLAAAAEGLAAPLLRCLPPPPAPLPPLFEKGLRTDALVAAGGLLPSSGASGAKKNGSCRKPAVGSSERCWDGL